MIRSRDSSSVGKGSPTGSRKLAAGPVVDLADALPCRCKNRVVPDSGKVMDGSSSLVSYDSRYAAIRVPRRNNNGQVSCDGAVDQGGDKKSRKARDAASLKQVGKFVLCI